ncbi:MAG: hypothetical protein ABI887_10835 [Burkholderiales bacterium]
MTESIVPTFAEHHHARMHLECRAQGALRVVLVRHRRAEDRHHRITDELFDECVEAFDHCARGGEQVRLQGTHVLGIQPLGDRGESGQIREQYGGCTAIGLCCDGSCGGRDGQLVAATGTEGKVDGYVE